MLDGVDNNCVIARCSNCTVHFRWAGICSATVVEVGKGNVRQIGAHVSSQKFSATQDAMEVLTVKIKVVTH